MKTFLKIGVILLLNYLVISFCAWDLYWFTKIGSWKNVERFSFLSATCLTLVFPFIGKIVDYISGSKS